MIRKAFVGFSVIVLSLTLLSAQSGPTFDVASVKRSPPASGKGAPEGNFTISGDSLTMRNASLKEMIVLAYGLKEHQVSGPDWLDSDRFDVTAKSATPVATEQVRSMLQPLLAERFKLEVHRETKDFAVAAMTVGKNGPKLGKAIPEGPVSIGIEQGKMVFQNYSMPKLAGYLSRNSGGRPVVDATGIDGFYTFSVNVLDEPSDNPIDIKKAIGMGSRDGTLARRIAEQIGLKLEDRKGPTEFLVVDHAEKTPSEN
jgi:uncharacterized protein (TIGR03435 family)